MQFNKIPYRKTLLASLVALGLGLGWALTPPKVALPSDQAPIHFYSNLCRKDLKRTLQKAIHEAHNSIEIIVYALTDEDIIHSLNEKKKEGLSIQITVDKHNALSLKKKLHPDIELLVPDVKGLMHEKIFIIDKEMHFIGSSNLTQSSLRMHDNLVVAIKSPELYLAITSEKSSTFDVGPQQLDFIALPQDKQALHKVIELIDSASDSIKIAMFTWTHPSLLNAVVEAHQRGVAVEVMIDSQNKNGSSKKIIRQLRRAQIPVYCNRGSQLMHHKFMIIDDQILLNGSTNWTQGAFKKNRDCFVILYDLNPEQKQFMTKLWKKTLIQGKKLAPAPPSAFDFMG